MTCRDKIVDVFVTKDDYEFDETFVTGVMSVEVVPVYVANTTTVNSWEAHVVNHDTDWLMANNGVNMNFKPGDLVRIGMPSTRGFTDYLTILEAKQVPKVVNGIYDHSSATATAPITGFKFPQEKDATFNLGVGETAKSGTFYVYRVNFSVNATLPPDNATTDRLNYTVVDKLQNRHDLEYNETWAETATADDTERAMRKVAYPLFKCKHWLSNAGDIRCTLDHGVKGINWIKLMGYTVMNKRQVGFQNNHELITDDWMALRLKDIQGKVVSNNTHANGSFAILHSGTSSQAATGSVEYHTYDPQGIASIVFESPMSTIRHLDMQLLNRKGEPAHFGRIHLWFKLCVAHG